MRRGPGCVVVAALVGLATGTGGARADDGSGTDAASVLARAGRAAQTVAFKGTVEVRWLDGTNRERTVQLEVRGGRTILDLGAAGAAATVVWGGALPSATPPPLAAKYRLRSGTGPAVADRPTTALQVWEAGQLAEVMDVDVATGLVLRRQQLDPAGQAVRSVTFVALTVADSGPMPQPRRPAVAVGHHVKAPLRVPAGLAGGYERVGTYRRGALVQALYSDGVHTLSLFEQRGRLDLGVLPAGGEAVRVGRWPATHYTWPGGQVLTWSSGSNATIVCVGDDLAPQVLAAARSLGPLPAPSSGVLGRLRRAAHDVANSL
jgi:hypothetical protein